MWPWTRSRSSPASTGELDVAAQLVRRGLGRAPARVGQQVGALQEQPLAVDRAASSRSTPTSRSPVRARAAVARLAVDDDLDRRSSVSGWSPSDRGHHSRGLVDVERPLDLVDAGGQRRARCSATTTPSTMRAHAHACARSSLSSAAVQAQVGARRRRRRGTAPAAGRCAPARCRTTRTGRHSPPGFQSRSMPSQCWNTPVMLRSPAVPRCGAHVTSTASTCSSPSRDERGDVEACGGRSSPRGRRGRRRRATRRPGRRRRRASPSGGAPGRPASSSKRRAVEQRAVAVGELGVASASGRARRSRAHVASSTSSPIAVAAQVVVGRRRPPRAGQLHRPATRTDVTRRAGAADRAVRRAAPIGSGPWRSQRSRSHPRRSCGRPAGSRVR